jgi:hypothetical protein
MEALTLKIDGILSQAMHSVFVAACAFSVLLLLTVLAYSRHVPETASKSAEGR